MEIKFTNPAFHHRRRFLKIIMRTFILLLCSTAFGFSPITTFSQEKIVIEANKKVTVDEVFKIIKNQTHYHFLYPADIFVGAPKIQLLKGEIDLSNLLNQSLALNNLDFELSDNNTIVIKRNEISTNNKFIQQEIQINGVVKDANNMPIPGVNVMIKGTNTYTQTDFDGNYTITLKGNNVLVFSFVGYVPQEVTVVKSTTINIILKENISQLEDVVVIGYGTVKKRDLTGAVSSVKGDDIKMAPVTSPIEAIQGRVAGLDISRNAGNTSGKVNILLRGNRSLTASSEPIYIIDGIQGNINNLNPNDIASIDVLKDASSTAIYGSAGANGVIIITTKTAKEGRVQIDFDSYVSVNSNPSFPSALQGDAWLKYLEEGYQATYGTPSANRDALLGGWNLSTTRLNPYLDNGKYVNWVDKTFQTGIQTNNTLSIRGGNEKVKASLSLGRNRTEGVYQGDNVNVYTMRSDLSIQAAKWAKFGLTSGIIFRDQNNNRSRVNKAFGMVPLGDVYDENGNINQFPVEGEPGIVSVLANNIPGTLSNNTKSINVTANPYAEFNLAKDLSFKSILGISVSNSRNGIFNSDHTYLMLTGSENAIRNAQYNTSLNYTYYWENILNHKLHIGEDHKLETTLITSYFNSQSESSFAYSEGFLYDGFSFYNLDAGVNKQVSSDFSELKRLSFAGRLNYSFKDRYFLTGSVRYDGVSQLAEKWDVFPAGAFAWRISDENFMTNVNWLNELKLRVGYGVSGNSNINAYATKSETTNGNDVLNLGGGQVLTSVPTRVVGNDLLGWEKSYNANIGLDFGFMNNRINGSLEFYNTDTKDVIYSRSLPSTLGSFSPKQLYVQNGNIAKMNNKGVELTLNTVNVKKGDFKWSSTLTFARNKEQVKAVNLGPNVNLDDLISLGLFVGSPKDVFYDYKKVGIWQLGEEADAAVFGLQPGDVKIQTDLTKKADGVWVGLDSSGNEVEYTATNKYAISLAKDRKILGHAAPSWTGGLLNTFKYKNFDLSVFATARWGQMIDGQLLGYFGYGRVNILDNYNYWTPTNPTNDFPRPYAAARTTTSPSVAGLNYVHGSFVKIKNITLGYRMPESVTKAIGATNFRVYGTVYNSFVFAKSHLLKGIDPETQASDSFPLYKQLVFGLNLSF